MDRTSYELSVIAYYLSEYDEKAVSELGYKTRTEAFSDISYLLGRENNYLKLRRDEFDVLTSSPRKGWRNRSPLKDVIELYLEYSSKSYEEVTNEVKSTIQKAKERINSDQHESVEETSYIEEVNRKIISHSGKKVLCINPQKVPEKREGKTTLYKRNPVKAINALKNADYKCEYCNEHKTFIRKGSGLPYTEPHHLVPMKAQKDFNVSLDVENNIVSLCSNCHNLIHYGKDAEIIIKELYDARLTELNNAGIIITLAELLKYYQ